MTARTIPPKVTDDIRALITDAGIDADKQDLVARILATGVGMGLDDTDRLQVLQLGVGRRGVGASPHLGDPRLALTWIANELSGLGIPLAKGEIVTTGTCMVPIAITAGDHIDADFGILGRISVTLT